MFFRFLHKPESTEYKTFRGLIAEIKVDRARTYNQAPPPPPPIAHIKQENTFKRESVTPSGPAPSYSNFVKADPNSGAECSGIKREATADPEETEQERRERKRRSRWGPQATEVPPIGVVSSPLIGQSVAQASGTSHFTSAFFRNSRDYIIVIECVTCSIPRNNKWIEPHEHALNACCCWCSWIYI